MNFEFDDLNLDPELQKLLDNGPQSQDFLRLRNSELHQGFDNNAGSNWIYPSNLPMRAYQLNIVQAALFRNTLVALPTGLGKTFIAAVVMYNIYRWYPQGKVIFMAPTRPLVAQQIMACARIMPFSQQDTVELTGKLPKSRRAELWRTKRVFFVTPQVLQSDFMETSTEFSLKDIKLLVADEAHKAKGRYAYVEVAQTIWQHNRNFRVLALSATPGRTMEDVAAVVRNLFISHIEMRSESSIDVAPYVHKRNMKTIVVPMGEQIERLRQELTDIIDPYLRQLQEANALSRTSLHSINRNVLIYEQKSFRERSMVDLSSAQQSKVFSNFSICISLYYALELLERHGVRVFLNNFEENEEGRAKFVLNIDRRLRDLVAHLRKEVGPNPFDVSTHTMTNGKIATIPDNLDFGHPKFEHARQVLLQHFQNRSDSRAIVFCEYRESVMLIYRLLMQHMPMLRPRCFVGQGGTTGSIRALTQKQQIEIMNDFRSNKSNILVATCIGEEGIDVGEVDLIVCFDINTSNPTRFIQRIGRTGRQKQGNVVMLVTEGREQKILKDVLSQKDQSNRMQHSNVVKAALYQHSPRLVPSELDPQCLHTFIKLPEETEVVPEVTQESKKKKGTTKSKNFEIKGTQDLRKFFSPTKRDRRNDADSTPNSQPIDDDYRKSPEPGSKIFNKLHAEKCINRFNTLLMDVSAGGILASNTQLLATPPVQANTPKQNNNLPEETITTAESSLGSRNKKETTKNKDFKIKGSQDLHTFFSPTKPKHDHRNDADSTSTSQQNDEDLILLSPEPSGIDKLHAEKCMNRLIPPKQLNARQLRKLNAFFQNNTPILSTFQRITNFREQLKCKKLSVAAKQMLLKLRPDFMRETLENMRVLEALDEMGKDSISPEEREIRLNYELLETVCGGSKSAVLRFLDDIEQKLQKPQTHEDVNFQNFTSDNLDFDVVEEQDFENCTLGIFKDLEMSGGRFCDNFDYIQQQLKQTQRYKKLVGEITSINNTTAFGESVIFDTISDGLNTSYDFSHIESKYCSQWDEFADKELPNKSTPLTRPRERRPEQINNTLTKPKEHPKQTNTSSSNNIISLLDDDNDIFESSFVCEPIETTPIAMPMEKITTLETAVKSTVQNSPVNSTVDLDLAIFMEPFSEEQQSPPTTSQQFYSSSPNGSTKENVDYCNTKTKQTPHSPDIFKMSIVQPTTKPSLSSKLASKTVNTLCKPALTAPLMRTPQKASTPLTVRQSVSVNAKFSSTQSATTTSPNQLKSPSVFDLYLRSMRVVRDKLPVSPLTSQVTVDRSNCDDAFTVRQSRTSKRRIFESDSDTESAPIQQQDQRNANKAVHFTEQTKPTERNSKRQQRKKRRRICSFVDDEARVSGGDGSDSEIECTGDNEMLASLLARSSEEEEADDVASTSYMQGVYLQSVKSPSKRPNTFKIPPHRVFNDNEFIYSQPPPIEHSQYEHDSFIVAEDDSKCKPVEFSICPLERAERILKERRRKRYKFGKSSAFKSVEKKSYNRLLNVSSDNSSDFESD